MDVSAVTGSASSATQNATSTDVASMVDFEQFLNLFVAQLRYQDPMSPMDGQEFLAETAQFSSVEQLVGLNGKISDLADSFTDSNRSTAAALIGRSVTASVEDAEAGTVSSVSGRVVQVDFDPGGGIVLGLEDGQQVDYADVVTVSET